MKLYENKLSNIKYEKKRHSSTTWLHGWESVGFVKWWEESGRILWLHLYMNLKSLLVFSSLSPLFCGGKRVEELYGSISA